VDFHYRITQLPTQLQINYLIQKHNHYSNTQLPPPLQMTLKNAKGHSHYSNTKVTPQKFLTQNIKKRAQTFQKYAASITVTNNNK